MATRRGGSKKTISKKASPKRAAPEQAGPKQAAATKRTSTKNAPKSNPRSRAPAAADLQARLQDRERQVRDLTEQCLHFLDLLHTARQNNPATEDLERKLDKLEEMLADARRRVRSSRSVLISGTRSESNTELEIVVWPTRPDALQLNDLGELADRFPKTSLTYVCPTAEVPTGEECSSSPNLQILAAECRTPAQFWNTAMAATDAASVLFLADGTSPDAGAIEQLASIQDDVLALGQPTLVHSDGETTLGLREIGQFEFKRSPARSDSSGLVELEFIAPEAFVIRRDAFHSLGPFDEDLLGHLALADYCIRAHKQALRLAGLPGARVSVPDRVALLSENQDTERDRLILLAEHRPGKVTDALTGMDLFWSLPTEELRTFLRALFVRLPGTRQSPEALGVLVQEALSLVQQTVPRPFLERSLEGVQEVVDSTFDTGEGPSRSADDSHSQDPVGATRRSLDRLRTTVDGLRAHVDAQRTANREQLESLQAQLDGERAANREQLESLQAQLETVLAQKEELEKSLRGELEAAQTDREELTARLEGERTAARDLRSELQAARAQIEAEKASKENQRLRFTDELQRARESHDILDRGVQLIAQALAQDDQRDPALLAHRARQVRADLAEREFWVTLLLQEIARWRLKPFPRKLSTQESRFLKEQGQDGSA